MLFFVTGNTDKFKFAKVHLDKLNIEIEQLDLDTTEIQSNSVDEFAKWYLSYSQKSN